MVFQRFNVKENINYMRYFHNASFFKWVAFLFACVIEFLLGVNVFNLVQVSTQAAIPDIPYIAPIVALIAGIAMFFGGVFVFLGSGYAHKAARDYTTYYGVIAWREFIVKALVVAIVALDITSLAFRMQNLKTDNPIPLLVFFVILALLPPVLGVIVDVFVNRPVKSRLADTIQNVKINTADELGMMLHGMPLSMRLQFLQGDQSVIETFLKQREQETTLIESRKKNESEVDGNPLVPFLES